MTEQVKGKIPPQDQAAEQSVLGAMMLDPEAIERVAPILRDTHFHRQAHQEIYRAILALWRRREPVDIVTVGDELAANKRLEAAGGHAYLAELVEAVPTAANVEHYARIVREKAMARQIALAAAQISERAYDGEDPEDLVKALDRLVGELQDAAAADHEPTSLLDVAEEILAEIERREPMPGTATGWVDLDIILGGIRPGELVVVGGRPSSGKTAFAINLALRMARPDAPALITSLETEDRSLAYRAIAQITGIPVAALMRRMVKAADLERARDVIRELAEHPVLVDDRPLQTVADIAVQARRMKRRFGLSVLLVDYLTLVKAEPVSTKENRAYIVERMAYDLLALARELHIPVVALAQLNRGVEHRDGHVPTLADLRESGGIEQAANVVLLMHRPAAYDKSADKSLLECIVAKHKDGPIGTARLWCDMSTMRIGNRADHLQGRATA